MEFPAKILLFGEYGILFHSMALALPYPRFSGKFSLWEDTADHLHEKEERSNQALKRLLHYLKSHSDKYAFLHLGHFEEEVNRGLYFDSSIPSGFGLGSSGALTAAIYKRYARNFSPDRYDSINAELAAIESCFHGVSSGIDPLTSLLGRAVLVAGSASTISTPDLSPWLNTFTLFLVNTHAKGNTGDLVTQFMEQYQNLAFQKKIHEMYIPVINQTIAAAIANDQGFFLSSLARYSQFQLEHFERMIPATMRKHFLYGLESGYFHLKICGSGGGGYLLAISTNHTLAENYFKMNHLDYTIV